LKLLTRVGVLFPGVWLAGGFSVFAAEPMLLPPDSVFSSWETSCSSAPEPSPVTTLPFSENEALPYRVSWGGITAGRGLIEVKGVDTVEGRSTYHFSMHLQTTGLTGAVHHFDEHTDSWVDQKTLLPRRYIKKSRESNFLQDEQVNLDQACLRYARYEHRLDKNREERKQGILPGETFDMVGYLFYVRTLPLKEGAHFDLTLLSGDHLWPVTVYVKSRLKVSAGGKWYDCFYLEPALRYRVADTKLKQLQVWISADARRLPVRLRMEANVGHITADLVER
jgi:hypothetical protein